MADLGHRKNTPKCPLNGTKKMQVQDRPIGNNFNSTITIFIILFLCRKRKPRLNRTKGWFPKELSTKSAHGQDGEDGGPSSPPRIRLDINHVCSGADVVMSVLVFLLSCLLSC
jgi:hypothetical protein